MEKKKVQLRLLKLAVFVLYVISLILTMLYIFNGGLLLLVLAAISLVVLFVGMFFGYPYWARKISRGT